MKTAEEKSNYYIWYVLDKIMENVLPGLSGEVTYAFSADVVRKDKPISYLSERKSLTYLQNHKVIEKVGDFDVVESGEKGTTSYKVDEIYTFKIKNGFFNFYDRFYSKVFGSITEKDRKITNRLIQNLVESLDGEYEKSLILLLSKNDKTAKELKETGAKDIRHLISNTNKKIIKRGFKIVLTKVKDTDGLRKYHLSIS